MDIRKFPFFRNAMQWDAHLPEEYLNRVGIPVLFERQEEASAGAVKVTGFDTNGNRCFYFHEYVLTEERFDEEETVFELPVYHELVYAWKLNGNGWLKLKAYTVSRGDCGRQPIILPLETVEESQLDR